MIDTPGFATVANTKNCRATELSWYLNAVTSGEPAAFRDGYDDLRLNSIVACTGARNPRFGRVITINEIRKTVTVQFQSLKLTAQLYELSELAEEIIINSIICTGKYYSYSDVMI